MQSLLRLLHAPTRQYHREFADCPIPDAEARRAAARAQRQQQEGAPSPSETSSSSGQPLNSEKKEEESFVVSFEDTPNANPRNWSTLRKSRLVIDVTLLAFQLTLASAISSTAIEGQIATFGIGEEASQLSTALFLIGFGFGGIPFGPLSEAVGRQAIYTATLFISTSFEIGAATAGHQYTLYVCRFLAGFWGAVPLSNAGGSLMDILNPVQRAYIFPIFAAAGFLGPAGAPVVGGYLAQNVSWRWNYHLTYITGFALAAYVCMFTEETLPDEILRKKAKYLRQRTGDQRWKAPKEKVPLRQVYITVLTKVPKLLATEPLVQFNTAYLSIVYFCLFGDLEAYPVIFGPRSTENYGHGLNNGQIGLTFIAICIGLLFTPLGILPFSARYKRKFEATHKPSPETHLEYMIMASILLPISIFWLGWTSFSSVNVWVPIASGLLFGFAVLFIFIGAYQNTIDSYGPHSASALGCLVLVRYLVSGGCALAIGPMFRNMRPWWAATVLGCVSAAMIPVTILLYVNGRAIRKRSPFAMKD